MVPKKKGSPKALRGLQEPLLGPEENTLRIPLTQEKYAIINKEDFDLVAPHLWFAQASERGTFYAITNLPCPAAKWRQKRLTMHNLLMGEMGIDHKDGNGLNNRRKNLRKATGSQNCANRRPYQNPNMQSRYKGVALQPWRKQKPRWKAYITLHKEQLFLGHYKKEKDAARAYDAAARELFGEFARLNFPEDDTCPVG